MSDTIIFRCSGCENALEAPGKLKGQQTHCPQCHKPITVPLEDKSLLVLGSSGNDVSVDN